MKKGNINSTLLILLVISLFPISYLYRNSIRNDINNNSLYTLGKVVNITQSLKSGEAWKYKFIYKNIEYESYRSTHNLYNINIGDNVLVNFSSQNPEHSTLVYEYKFNPNSEKDYGTIWREIPKHLLISTKQ